MWRQLAPFKTLSGLGVLVGLLMPLPAGCNLLRGAVLLWGQEPVRDVPADYPHLAGKKVCVLVWAEAYTLFEYPDVQLELSEFVRVAMEAAVPQVSFVSNREVVDYQRRNPDWDRENPARIGARFGADRVLEIQLTQYTTREPDSPHLYRGHIAGSVKVYDAAEANAQAVYKTTLETSYPPDSFGAYGTNDRKIRRATMQAFAAEVAGKFYKRQEKVK